MNFGSLFAGIGGIDLGLERAGMECAWQVEIDEFCRRVLTKHWPNVPKFEDVKECGKHNLERVRLIAFGFPCQDISYASPNGAGIDGTRSGMWTHGARIISELRPDYALVENVPALLERGMGRVLGDLAALGYDAEWHCLSARAFGAPHLRERVFIFANSNGKRIKAGWHEQIQRVEAFSWCKDVRRVEDLRGRPDIPESVIRRTSNGLSIRVDRIGNAVVPQIAEWIGRRIMNRENETKRCEACGAKAEKNCEYGEGEGAARPFPLCSRCYIDHIEKAHRSNKNAQDEARALRTA